jgi:hypothetical protein
VWEVETFMKAKLKRISTFQKCSRGPRDGLTEGSNLETFEDLENFLSQKSQKLKRGRDNYAGLVAEENIWTSNLMPRHSEECKGRSYMDHDI